MTSSILHTDVLAAFKTMPENSYHGCLTDPPYGLSFMSHGWDHGVPSVDVWRELLRVLRPGAHVLAFGGTRTFHRLTCAIEDAGFEIRDCMMWLYGSGFPKSHDVSKAIDREAGATREVVGERKHRANKSGAAPMNASAGDVEQLTAPATEAARQWEGHGTALKPAWEPIIVARKPLDGTVAQNVQRWGCGGLAIDASRVAIDPGSEDTRRKPVPTKGWCVSSPTSGSMDDSALAGRWPANVILDEEAGQVLDAQSGNRPSTPYRENVASGDVLPLTRRTAGGFSDSGGASRFFYQAKASRAERDAGLDGFELGNNMRVNAPRESESAKTAPSSRNIHPTVKPLALARYLGRLILPPIPDARMVVPFCGSGSEVIGALQSGWSHVDGIDSWDVAVDIARARVEHWSLK